MPIDELSPALINKIVAHYEHLTVLNLSNNGMYNVPLFITLYVFVISLYIYIYVYISLSILFKFVNTSLVSLMLYVCIYAQICINFLVIKVIENLDPLIFLEELNLSCNQITQVRNLQCLSNLFQLNLSKNQVTNLNDLSKHLPSTLQILDLSSNKLTNLKQVCVELARACPKLHTLDLRNNPLSGPKQPDDAVALASQSEIYSHLPHLKTLNGASTVILII